MKYWFIGCILFFAACNQKNKVPVGILQKDSMQHVFKDLLMVDEFVTTYITKDTTKNQKIERQRRYEQVFALHHTSQAEFKKSFDYYRLHPYLMKDIFDSLSVRTKQDSINRITKPDSVISKIKPADLNKIDTAKMFKPIKPFRPDTTFMHRLKRIKK